MASVFISIILYLFYLIEFSSCRKLNLDEPQFSVNYGNYAGSSSSTRPDITAKIIIHCLAAFSGPSFYPLDVGLLSHSDYISSNCSFLLEISMG